jgi:hypothetical protein
MPEDLEEVDLTSLEVDEISVCLEYIRQVMPGKKFLLVVYEPDSRPKSGLLARCGSNMKSEEIKRALIEVRRYVSRDNIKVYAKTKRN